MRSDLDTINHANNEALISESGPAAKILVALINKATSIQSGTVQKYVDWVKSKNPSATPAELQVILDKHFMRVISGTGAGAGSMAAVPGVGFITGAAAVGAESLLFVDAAALYALSSAHLRGADIRDPERRKAVVLMAIVGSAGSALVDATVGRESTVALVSRMTPTSLSTVNKRLMKVALKKVSKSARWAFIGKLMPLGIGAVVGFAANRKIGRTVIEHVAESLGPVS